MTRVGKIAKGIGAFVLLVALMVGIPYALWHFVGWPLPHQIPSWSGFAHDLGERGIPDRTLVDALAVAVWLTWAVLMASLVAEVPAAIGGRSARRFPIARAFQPLTGHLVATLLVAILALSPRPTHASAASLGGIARAGGHQPVAALVLTDTTAAVLTSSLPTSTPSRAPLTVDDALPAVAPAASNAAERTYVVQRGDTLWGIAERELGDPLRWSELYRLNAGRPQPGGRTLTDANWIDPGWTLVLPSSPGVASTAPTSPSTAHAPAPSPTTTPPVTTEPTTTVPATTDPAHAAPPTSVAPPASTRSERTPAGGRKSESDGAPAAPVRLPSGSIVGGSFAFGILSALALARLRRRHAYRYRPPEPGRDLGRDPLRPTLRAFSSAVQPAEDEDEGASERAPFEIVPAIADEDPDHRERPDLIEVGTRDGEPVAVSLSELAGVVLRGPDAEDVARAWVAALLVRAGPLAAEVLTTETTVERLVPGAGVGAANGEVPGLRVVANNDAVLCLLEAEVLARSRQLEADDAPDIVTYRHTYPWDPLPSIVGLVDEVPVADSGRWAAVCSSGSRLGLGAVVLAGESPSAVHLDLDADHVVVATSPEDLAWRFAGVRCFALRPDEAADVFATLTEVERRPSSDEEPDETAETPTDVAVEEEPWPASVRLAPEATEMPGEAHGPSQVSPPIAVRLFGPYEIIVDGETVASGLRGVARELLAWYLLRPEGASIGAAVDACWSNTDPVEVSTKFWRAASDLRKHIGRVARPATQLLVQVGDAYRLDPQAIECDLWQFQAALTDAAGASDDTSTRDALRRVVACYRGEFVENADYRWVEPVRQDLHRRALDAYLRLAELEEQFGAPDAAEEVLGRAIELDRYAEEPYRRLMTLQGVRDRPDTVAATWRLLERRLAEIDVDPEPATVRLYRSLSAPLTTRESHSGPLRLSS